MPLTIPKLDDRTFSQLVGEARLLIPAFAPEWTNHNTSDPGITLVELFAYFTELLLFRLDQLTDGDLIAFLRLLNGPDWKLEETPDLREAIGAAVLRTRTPNRAVTADDYEYLALKADPRIARAHCVVRRDLTASTEPARRADRPGHITVLIVPRPEYADDDVVKEIIDHVRDFLEPRRLVTTRIHVAQPRTLQVGVQISVVLKPGASSSEIRRCVVGELTRYLDPLVGGSNGTGWEFGRAVYLSEILQLLDSIEGVDYVTRSADPDTGRLLDELVVAPEEARRVQRSSTTNDIISIALHVDELVSPSIREDLIHPVDPAFRGGLLRRKL
jgi:hypothetical protein